MKCKQCGKEMTINLKFGISEFVCECGYQTDEMAILNEELQYLRKIKDDYIDSDKALEITKLTAKFASDLMMASYFDFMNKQQKTEKKPDLSVKIENDLYSKLRTNIAHSRQITELTKKMNDDFDKKITELKKQHIKEIKEAVKKARKRQKYADFPDELINNIMNIMITEEITEPVIKLKEIQDVIDGFYLSDWEVK